jgi:hypothetical protein
VRIVAAVLIAAAGIIAALLAMRDPDPATVVAAPPGRTVTATATPTPTRTPRPRVRIPRCPADVAGCAAVRGPVIYVERVDPDGDGDLHVVVVGGSVTLPGATSIDVAKELRPRHDPRVGDVVSAAGPVQRGHLGQDQVHALVFRTPRG